MAYIKGIYIQDIFVNEANGYTVGLLRVKESDDPTAQSKVITFTGIFDELKYKATYKMEGEFTLHNKYGRQFQVSSYELVLPTEKEEVIEFLSSDLFPIGITSAEKIVDKLGKDAISKILKDPTCLYDIPRLPKKKIAKIAEVLEDYESTSHIVIELNKIGFNTKDSISILKKHGAKSLDLIEKNIYNFLDDIDITFDEIDKIARNNGYSLNDERRLEALVIHAMNVLTFNSGDTYLYLEELEYYIKKHTDNLDTETLEYILLKLSKLKKVKITGNRYYLQELYDAEV